MKNAEKKVLGYTIEEIRRQTKKTYDVDPQSSMGPMKKDFAAIDPVIEGARKINNDLELKEFIKDISTKKKAIFIINKNENRFFNL